MMQLAILLLGVDHLQNKSRYLMGLSLLWGIAGALIFIDGLDGQTYFPVNVFGGLLLLESAMTLMMSSACVDTKRKILVFKGGGFLFCALVILINHRYSNLLLSAILCFAFIIIGFFSALSACVVRFPRWRSKVAHSTLTTLFSILLFSEYLSVISFLLGFLMTESALRGMGLAWRFVRLRPAEPLFREERQVDASMRAVCERASNRCEGCDEGVENALIIHVWTPEGAASAPVIPRPVINRYIASVDENGVISTGHAAVEIPGKLYISLYPAEDIDRSPSEFLRLLKATQENNVQGRYLTDYVTEAQEWRHSDRKIVFSRYNEIALKRFWDSYSQTEVYNLTYRNCSSTVACALEAALEGVLAEPDVFWRPFARMMLTPELWIASQLRRRALAMAWTPGLVLDYARALNALVQPVSVPWSACLGRRIFMTRRDL